MTIASPNAWNAAWARYATALAAEAAYDAEHISPHIDHLPVGPKRDAAVNAIPAAVWTESGLIGEARADAEDVLFAMPSPNLEAFARKVIICRADERDLSGLDGQLVEEARRLLDAASDDQHPVWLADRNRLWTIINQRAPMADGLMDDLTEILSVLEKRIAETPATTPMGWIAKAAVLLQRPSEGFEPGAEVCAAALTEAQSLFGIAPLEFLEVAA